MFPSRTSESLPFSQFPQYLYTSSLATSANNHALAIPELTEAPNLVVPENMNYYYDDPPVNYGNVSNPSRIQQPLVEEKDKHHKSKIQTARGPRDRRVRLSIEVSKKFFGLQDMLGFDRASKTLDWLFTKSKLDIEELSQKQVQLEAVQVTKSVENVDLVGHMEKPVRQLRRVEARARARERTRKNQSLSLMRSKCNNSTTIMKVDVEMDKQLCNNEKLSHMNYVIPPKEASRGDILLGCTTTGNTWETSWKP